LLFASADFGTVTVSTPFLNETLFSSISCSEGEQGELLDPLEARNPQP
jgi:hypothetical protein